MKRDDLTLIQKVGVASLVIAIGALLFVRVGWLNMSFDMWAHVHSSAEGAAYGRDSAIVIGALSFLAMFFPWLAPAAVLAFVLSWLSLFLGGQSGGTLWGFAGFLPLMAGHVFLLNRDRPQSEAPARAVAPQGAANGADSTASPGLKHLDFKVSRKNLASIVGMAELKDRLKMAAQEIVSTRGSEEPRNGILLHGEPGNGKTHFAEALAGEMNLKMIQLRHGDVASRWINQTTEAVVQAFADAKAHAPCMLFIDEIDSLLTDRARVMHSEDAKTTTTLLTELVDIRRYPVVVVAATNYLDRLDPAGIREGRFDFKIEVPTPDEPARIALLAGSLKQNAPHVRVARDAVERAAKRWVGYSSKRLQAVGEQVREISKKTGRSNFSFDDLMGAMRALQGRAGRIPENTKSLDEMILSDAARRKLSGIATRMNNIERIENLAAKLPTGVIFFGPPGTGKTEAARALAKATGWAFLHTSGNELMADPDRWDKLIREAKEIRPVIVFLDEADDILRNRQTSGIAALTNKILTTLDGASGKIPDIVFVAATNFIDEMDQAALRGGRFTEKVEFSVPGLADLEEYIHEWVMKHNITSLFETEPHLAEALEGLSIANVAAILQEALNEGAVRSLESGSPYIELDPIDISNARNVVVTF